MEIIPLSDTLWIIKNIYPDHIIKECQSQDINSIPWQPLGDGQYSQSNKPRRVLTTRRPHVFSRLNDYISEYIPQIIKLTKKSISNFDTDVWADYPGYRISRHIDNDAIYITMQIYLNEHTVNLGTNFSDNIQGPYKYSVPYKTNVGYLMVNSPTNYHGLDTPVPADFIRLSSYTRFNV